MEIEEKPTLHRIPHHSIPFLLQHRTYSHLTRHNPSRNMSQNCTVQNQLLQKSMKAHESTIQYTNSILWKPRIGLLSPALLPRHARSTPPSTGSRIPTRLHTALAKEKELGFIEIVQALKITQEHCYLLCWLNRLRQNMKHEVSPQSCWLWESKEGFLVWGWHDDERVFMLKRASIHFCHPILALSQRS